jgi:peptidoglycan/xylan/chitin deacetylase (PgdA/CDA1 family)
VETVERTATMTPEPSMTPSATPSSTPTETASPTPLPTATPTWQTVGPGAVEVAILLYHRIQPEPSFSSYIIDTDTFQAQMQILSDRGCQTISIDLLRQAIVHGAALPPKPIIITFDDGNVDNYDHAFPILNAYGFTATAYIVANRLESDGFLTSEHLEQLVEAGWEIGSHSMTHADLAPLDWKELRTEILNSRLDIEEALEIDVRSFAYPFGIFSAQAGKKVFEYGYYTAVGLGKRNVHQVGDLYYLNRREVKSWMSLDDFETLLGACSAQE